MIMILVQTNALHFFFPFQFKYYHKLDIKQLHHLDSVDNEASAFDDSRVFH